MSGTAVTIERFNDVDDPSVVLDIIIEGLTERYGTYLPHLNPDLEDFVGFYRNSFILVAKHDSLIAGTGILQPAAADSARIVRMSVRQGYRRLGIGSLILNALLQIAREQGLFNITLETTASWTSAIEFYKRHYFVPTCQQDGNQYFARIIREA